MKFNLSFLFFLPVLLIIFIFQNNSFGQTTYYVSSSQGNDSNNGTSSTAPWKSLAKLQSIFPSAKPGDKFLLKRGDVWTDRSGTYTDYAGIVGLDLSMLHGNSNSYVVIGAYGDGDNPTFNFSGTGSVFQLEGATYLKVENLILTSPGGAANNRPKAGFYGIGSKHGGGHDIIFDNIKMDLLQEGIRVQDGVNTVIIQNCWIGNTLSVNEASGNGVFASTNNIFIKNTTFYNCGGYDNLGNYNWSNGHSRSIYLDGCYNVEISGCTASVGYAQGFVSLTNVHNTTVNNNKAYDMGFSAMDVGDRIDAISTSCSNVTIENNIIYNAVRGITIQNTGGALGSGTSGITIINNLIYDCSSVGIRAEGLQLSNSLIANNTIYNCGEAIRFSSNVLLYNIGVKNNIFFNNSYSSGTLLAVANSSFLSDIDVDYNLYYNTVGSETNVGGTIRTLAQFKSTYTSDEQHSIFGDPLFIDPSENDFELKVGSPAIQAGIDLGLRDISGNLTSGKPDIGAFQYGTSSGLKIFLEGSYENGVMTTGLEDQNIIPLSQPYFSSPWTYSGNESVASIPQNIVDWVLVELRKSLDVSSRVSQQASFINSNGYVVDLSGNKNISFNVSDGDYYVVIIHRNHLAVMSANPVSIVNGNISYDFTTGEDKAYGQDAMADLGNGVYGMYGGDSDSNGIINDSDVNDVGNSLFSINYLLPDLDLNSKVNVIDYKLPKQNLGKKTYVTGIFAL